MTLMRSLLRPTLQRARKVLSFCSVIKHRSSRVSISSSVKIQGKTIFRTVPGSRISIGPRVTLNSDPRKNNLGAPQVTLINAMADSAVISIGADTGISSATISAATKISIGERVLIGVGVLITDNDHHPVETPFDTPRRFAPMPKPDPSDGVHIKSDVFIGAGAIILKGVSIGEGSVVGAGSVVVSNVPPRSVAVGNPARVVRSF